MVPQPDPQQQLPFQQQYLAPMPVVPLPGTEQAMQYGGQWPHSSQVNTVTTAMPYTGMAPSTMLGHAGQPILVQHQGPPSDGGHVFVGSSSLQAGSSSLQAGSSQDGFALADRNG